MKHSLTDCVSAFSVLQGNASCEIENRSGVVTLKPLPGCICLLNDREVTEPCRLAQGQFSSDMLLSAVFRYIYQNFWSQMEHQKEAVLHSYNLISLQ